MKPRIPCNGRGLGWLSSGLRANSIANAAFSMLPPGVKYSSSAVFATFTAGFCSLVRPSTNPFNFNARSKDEFDRFVGSRVLHHSFPSDLFSIFNASSAYLFTSFSCSGVNFPQLGCDIASPTAIIASGTRGNSFKSCRATSSDLSPRSTCRKHSLIFRKHSNRSRIGRLCAPYAAASEYAPAASRQRLALIKLWPAFMARLANFLAPSWPCFRSISLRRVGSATAIATTLASRNSRAKLSP
mmetsp:Transcript_6552/g.14285  ORF Transcript_6552/g.14285 Transcript_6552/m.14285 type:complete len:242 (-) Transcript_6552:1228-1953(-)